MNGVVFQCEYCGRWLPTGRWCPRCGLRNPEDDPNKEARRAKALASNNTDPNQIQIGGGHYQKQEPQVWDVSLKWGLNGVEHSILKYLGRWRNKYDTKEKQLEDLRKMKHCVEKLIHDREQRP